MPRCRVITRFGTGVDTVDQAAAEAAGIAVLSVRDYCIPELPTHTLALAFALVRRLTETAGAVDTGWDEVASQTPLSSYRRATAAIARMNDSRARASARRELATQVRDLESFGALRYVAAINRQLRRRTAARSVSGPLTRRQQRVAVLISRGWTDRRIARAIGVSDRAVGGLVRSVLTGLGVATRSQVAAWVADHPGLPRTAPALAP